MKQNEKLRPHILVGSFGYFTGRLRRHRWIDAAQEPSVLRREALQTPSLLGRILGEPIEIIGEDDFSYIQIPPGTSFEEVSRLASLAVEYGERFTEFAYNVGLKDATVEAYHRYLQAKNWYSDI